MTRKLALVAAAALVLAMLTAGIAVAAGSRQPDEVQPAEPAAETTVSELEDSEAADDGEDADGEDADASDDGEAQDSDENLTGAPAERAVQAALAATGGGTMLEVEAGDDPNASYEVEIRTADGGVAEVLLDADFNVIGTVAGDDD
jgi:uncharacterized membrane protein YkoI